MTAAALALLCAAVLTAGCSAGTRQPTIVSRELLGTVVTITSYGTDDAALRVATDAAFARMAQLEAELDPYDPTSTVAAFNAAPFEWHSLPDAAAEVLDRVAQLGVGAQFSPTLFGVTKLYDFGGKGSVPDTTTLALATNAAKAAAANLIVEGSRPPRRAEFASDAATPPVGAAWTPGLDFGGASKGLAIDRAMERLRKTPRITGAMITAGSSTQVWGRKPNGEPWRIGIEDPRDTGTVLAVVGAQAPDVLDVSTSGDYQLFFERGGVRYHHILDPASGRPARGLRALTVYGNLSGLDADILSTALFVMGPSAAKEWAQRKGVGLYAVDDRGRVIAVSAPKGAGVTFERTGVPKP